ncbi:hypothetical protein GYMLUDRAFT_54444 [Collybiopsis luxurians FD-317 M1]|nr:hypothetical protein GYMLUDRAFT_54444 [Collybiopsis luxurians FD-317 M1]
MFNSWYTTASALLEFETPTICSIQNAEYDFNAPRRSSFVVTDSMAAYGGNSAVSSLAGAIGPPSSYAPQGYINPEALSMQENFHQSSSDMGATPTTEAVAGHLYSAEINNQQTATEKTPAFAKGGSTKRKRAYKFSCNFCPRRLTTKQRLQTHTQRHSGNSKTHMCHFCGRKYAGDRSLKRHQRNKKACPKSTFAMC